MKNVIKNKYVLLIAILSCCFFQSKAQFGNEWINYNQQYFKFKVYRNGIHRITQQELLNAGMPANASGASLQLFREGQEIPMFVSNSTFLGNNDYIEFFGEKANGNIDKKLYYVDSNQLNPAQNLISDTAFYFLTINTTTPHLRYDILTNSIAGSLTPEPYFWDTIRTSYRINHAGGPSYFGEGLSSALYFRSSEFEYGEGYVNNFFNTEQSVTLQLTNPYKNAAAPAAKLETCVVGWSYIPQHRVEVYTNNNKLADSTFNKFKYKRFNLNVPMSMVDAQNRVIVKHKTLNTSGTLLDRVGLSYNFIKYPREFNMANVNKNYVELSPKATDYYLEFTNFNTGGLAPRLYDLTSNRYLIGDISVAGKVRFLVPSSAVDKKLFLISSASGVIYSVDSLKEIQFKNYTLAANQGDYVILSHPVYYNDGIGNNYVEEYKDYRGSIAGGNYKPIVVNVEDLYNEFGYGYYFHAQAIKNFLNYSRLTPSWTTKLKDVLILGKGLDYNSYRSYCSVMVANPNGFNFVPIPTFGLPGSDILLTDLNNSSIPKIPIGRIPVSKAIEIKNYLDKVIEHEYALNNNIYNTADSLLWRKKVLHIAGSSEIILQNTLLQSLNSQKTEIEDSLYGGKVFTIAKSSTTTIESAHSKIVDDLVNGGLSFIQFYGHGNSSGMDYNLDFPSNYKNKGKYPFFLANGCSVGNMFLLSENPSISTVWVLEKERGTLGFISSVGTGVTSALSYFSDSLYNQISKKSYKKTIGEQMFNNIVNLASRPSTYNDFIRTQSEQILLQGDPAVLMFGDSKPDYAVEDKSVVFNQLSITTNLDSFDVDVIIYNLGLHNKDSVDLLIKRTLPNNTELIIYAQKYKGFAYSDTIKVRVPVLDNLAIGQNTFEVIIDQENKIDETSETNNYVKKVFNIFNDDLVPVYPYDFSIVNNQSVYLKASTLNAFTESRQYVFQIDTTEHFNSTLLKTNKMTSVGGLVKWQPNIILKDSTVYYWRTAMDTLYGNTAHRWSTSSFIFLNNTPLGWNQSHYFQYKKNGFQDFYIDSNSRKLVFKPLNKKLQIQNVVLSNFNPYVYSVGDYIVKVDGVTNHTFGCYTWPRFENFQFMVIDSLSGKLWRNELDSLTGKGKYGSNAPCRNLPDFFDFSYHTVAGRKAIMDFIDSIPNGYYVTMTPFICGGNCGSFKSKFVNELKVDSTIYGVGNTLYDKIYNMGFTLIDSFDRKRPMIFFMRKGMPATVDQHMGIDSTVKLYREFDFKGTLYEGEMSTDKIGPAKSWTSFFRKGTTQDPLLKDTVGVTLYGIDNFGAETNLATFYGDTSLAFVNAAQFPYIRLRMKNADNTYATPEQIKYWRVHFSPVPELALAPNRHFVFKDTLGQGEIKTVEIALENLTDIDMDSVLVNYSILDPNNNPIELENIRYKPLNGLDTIHAKMNFNSSNFSGNYLFAIEANPNKDQLEQFHPNNIGYKSLFINSDQVNPLLDVTFDGVHILNKDIVSAKPFINIMLKDENKYLALDDTSLMKVFLKMPNENEEVLINYDQTTLKFIPADIAKIKTQNQARIEFRPTLLKDGLYELILEGKDKIGNVSKNKQYKISFNVVNKPSFSSMLNYPNPFSTSTQFVFTITGSEVPSNIKIQIISSTGKVVREITKAELGNLHIGRNITEFRWKGDDQFGTLLGNGVYLYRVVSTLNGSKMDKFENELADKWIEKGFGKLYIMR